MNEQISPYFDGERTLRRLEWETYTISMDIFRAQREIKIRWTRMFLDNQEAMDLLEQYFLKHPMELPKKPGPTGKVLDLSDPNSTSQYEPLRAS